MVDLPEVAKKEVKRSLSKGGVGREWAGATNQ